MPNFDTNAVTPVLKFRYTKKKIETLAFESPTVAMIPKDSDYGGANYTGAIRNATTGSVSSSDAIAFTTGTQSVYQQWVCPWAEKYASANITGGAIARSKGDANALVDGLLSEFDGVFISLGIALGNAIWNNGGEALGQISAASTPASSATITLANIGNIVNFQVGYILQASATDGTSGSLRTGTVTITNVDVMLGTITVSGATFATGIAAIAASDYLFMQGSFGLGLKGIPAWIPPPALRPQAGDSFNGVNRFSDPVRLAGCYYAGNGSPKRETMNKLAILVNRMGGRPSHLVCNPVDYGDLLNELGTNLVIESQYASDAPQVAFPGVALQTAFGKIVLMQDPFCPQGLAWMLNFDEWLMPSMGDVPMVIGSGIDDLEWLRNTGADSYQLRAVYRATTYCAAPGHQGVLSW